MKSLKVWNIYDAISVAIDVYKTQGYLRFTHNNKKPNKQVIIEFLENINQGKALVPDHHESVISILEMKKNLVIKKMCNKITGYEQKVLELFDSGVVDIRYVGLLASIPHLHSNNLKKNNGKYN